MCTVSFLPIPDSGFILTSNRDEQHHRAPALPPKEYELETTSVVFPKDTQAGGTWIATSGKTTVCLLNGAFAFHASRPPYRKSRGLMVLDFFSYASVEAFTTQYSFENIEPFTLLVVSQEPYLELTEIRWTESSQLHVTPKSVTQPHIWSSATLYDAPIRQKREDWFATWLAQHPDYQMADIVHFHQTAGTEDVTQSLLMHRPSVGTISITSIASTPQHTSVWYKDLRQQQITHFNLALLPV